MIVLSGCLPRQAAPVIYPTVEAAVAAGDDALITVYHAEPFGEGETMVLYREEGREPSIAILRQTRQGWTREWRGGGGGHRYLGSLTYSQSHLGRVETKVGDVTRINARSTIVFGEVFDPAITWITLTLSEPNTAPHRATVTNGLWFVQLPPEHLATGFTIEGGNGLEQRFLASQNTPKSGDLLTGPLVEYRDRFHGLALSYPTNLSLMFEGQERLIVNAPNWFITVERSGEEQRTDPGNGPQAFTAPLPAGAVLEEGSLSLGGHAASYLLEGTGDPAHPKLAARYFVSTPRANWAVSCEMRAPTRMDDWEQYHQPECQRVLDTIRFEP